MIFGKEDANNTHCKACGSLLYSVVRDGAFVHVAMRTLIDDPSIRPTHNIFVGRQGAVAHYQGRPALVAQVTQSAGYSLLSFTRAWSVVNCQSALA